MNRDGIDAEVENAGDLLIRLAIGDQSEDLLFARRQAIERSVFVMRQRGAKELLAARNGADRVRQFDVDRVFEQMPVGAGVDRVAEGILV